VAEQLVGSLRARHDPAANAGMPAHVTLLYPFLRPGRIDAGVERSLGEVLTAFSQFEFTLARVGRFPGVLYLAPEPREAFVRLTEALVARWPGCPPYGGQYEEVVPHLTVAMGTEPPGVADSLAAALPIRTQADRAALMMRRRGEAWATRIELPFANGGEA
jgi:2'-5' RNA ligase